MAELFLGGTIDPATHDRDGDDVRIDTDKFTTHGVIVGMTGSGKTGLGVVLIEEVLSAGLPVLIIDPKGDLTNLCLTFPDLAPADFRPWIDEAQAGAADLSPDEFAAQQAELWTKGLDGWQFSGDDISKLRSTTDFSIYTPGSQSGIPVNIVGSLQVPDDMSDAEIVGDEIEGYVSGLLGLVGIEADPLSSREHILLSNLINHEWQEDRALDLPTLVGLVGKPPIRKLGVFELDQFFPPNDRMKLAMQLNGLLASPSFAAWAEGPALDIQSMLYDTAGKPRCAIVTTAHLSDDERQFVTSLVLTKLVTWMRRQSGTTDLRAMLYMDEVAGYLPPTANPPTKKPIMTLMKQATCVRRRGGVVDAEPDRRRLQGAVQRRHVDDRPSSDRPRQDATPRRPQHRVGWRRRRSGRRHDLRFGQARVRACVERERTRPRCSPHDGR